MVIDPDKVADENPGMKITIEHADKKDHKENKITFVPGQRTVASARQTTRALDALGDLANFVKGLAGLVVDALAAPALAAGGVATGQGMNLLTNAFVTDGERVVDSLIDLIDKIIGSRDSCSLIFDVPLTELDAKCLTGYSLVAIAQGEYSSGDSQGSESGTIVCEAQWGTGTAKNEEHSVDARNVQQFPLAVVNNLVGQSGNPGTANIRVTVTGQVYAGAGFRDKSKPSSAKLELKKVILTFADNCPGH